MSNQNEIQEVISIKVPENGLYYHYKHNPKGDVNNYAYEVMGVGIHTEKDCRVADVNMVVYRPLYKTSAYEMGKFFYLRPREMFVENVTKDGKTFPRFTKITDTDIIAELESIKEEMYGSSK